MSYEDMAEAINDKAWEMANEWLYGGEMDESIIEMIMNGAFDQAVTARANVLQNVPNLDEIFKAYDESDARDMDEMRREEDERIRQYEEAEAEEMQDHILAQQELEDVCKDSDYDNYYDGSCDDYED